MFVKLYETRLFHTWYICLKASVNILAVRSDRYQELVHFIHHRAKWTAESKLDTLSMKSRWSAGGIQERHAHFADVTLFRKARHLYATHRNAGHSSTLRYLREKIMVKMSFSSALLEFFRLVPLFSTCNPKKKISQRRMQSQSLRRVACSTLP